MRRFGLFFTLAAGFAALSGGLLYAEDPSGTDSPTGITEAVPGKKSKSLRYALMPSVGFSLISYKEPGIPNLSLMAGSVRCSFDYQLVPTVWLIGVETSITALPLSSSRSDTNVSFLTAAIKGRYNTRYRLGPAKLAIQGGFSLDQMNVTADLFGYRSLLYPELFPAFQWAYSPKILLNAYIKFVPLSTDLQSRKLGLGLSWNRALSKKRVLTLSLDGTLLNLNLTNSLGQTVGVSSSAAVLGVGYGI